MSEHRPISRPDFEKETYWIATGDNAAALLLCIDKADIIRQTREEEAQIRRLPRVITEIAAEFKNYVQLRKEALEAKLASGIYSMAMGADPHWWNKFNGNPEDIYFATLTDKAIDAIAANVIQPEGAVTWKERQRLLRQVEKKRSTAVEYIEEAIPREMLREGSGSEFFKSPVFQAYAEWADLQKKMIQRTDPFGALIVEDSPFFHAFETLRIGQFVNPEGRYHPCDYPYGYYKF